MTNKLRNELLYRISSKCWVVSGTLVDRNDPNCQQVVGYFVLYNYDGQFQLISRKGVYN